MTGNTDYPPGLAEQTVLVNFLAIKLHTLHVTLLSEPRKESPYPGKGNKEVKAPRL